jgi:hypothetical protein
MKKIYFIFTLILFTSVLKSQTLTTDLFPSPGDVYEYFYTDTLGIVPGPAGASQEWNFEDLNVDTVLQVDTYLSPITTTPPVTGHTTAIGDTLQGFSFFKNTAAKYEMLGISDSANVTVVVYSNPMTLVTFPFTFGNTSTDNFAFTTSFQGNNVNATGTITTTADGSGNILLPQGAFNNVLRVKINIVTNFTVLIFNVTQTQTIYEWYDGNYKFPLLHIENTTTTDPFGGPPFEDKSISLKATGPAGLKSIAINSDFNLTPNPAHEQVNIKLNNTNISQTKIIITNAVGQLVYENHHVDSQLSNLNISTSDLEKGVYFVSVTQNNQTFTKKLVVQ